ncbi:uncharacterized protein LOC105385747 isoform X3 [Plutella xylostella]|uniref:uncharacterized protein LOC105385747 isoform X3 n=1 Tax=Plutella xylostella TaxID=51655 RepID=UPI0020321E1C|nr:uncharacterized protein LOC105385747 isoform X3 [Plutella xylostella]
MKSPKRTYPTQSQIAKLIRLIAENPQLVSYKASQDFNYQDSQRLWQFITNQCNALPGARKTWKQWRRTFHDIRTKSKRRQKEMNGEIPYSARKFSPLEQELLGYNLEFSTQAAMRPRDHEQDTLETNYTEDSNSDETQSPPETKTFQKHRTVRKIINKRRTYSTNQLNSCLSSCDFLATQEQEKIRIKEDYLNFKKDYFREKLKVLKEQTEALKSIARNLAK